MKKKGFTLIELLAVIVILAVIALIVTPIVTSIISQAKDSANARSVEGHIKGVEYLVLEVSFKSSGNINKYDGTYPSNNVNLLARLANDGMHLQSSDKIDCETYVVSNGLITEATGCKETEWSKTYNYTNTGGAVVSGSGSSQTSSNPYLTTFDGNYTYKGPVIIAEDPTGYDFNYSDFQAPSNSNVCPSNYAYYEGDGEHSAGCYYVYNGYCDRYSYNYETAKCEEIGYNDASILSSEWEVYLRNDGTIYETCGVFGSGLAGTVCLTSPYYNSDYSNPGSYGNYSPDFEDCNSGGTGEFTSSDINNSCLRGYSLTKVQEMLSKGASLCNVDKYEVDCYMPSDGSCTIYSYGNVYCSGYEKLTGSENYYRCDVNIDGSYTCSE